MADEFYCFGCRVYRPVDQRLFKARMKPRCKYCIARSEQKLTTKTKRRKVVANQKKMDRLAELIVNNGL